MKNIKYILLLVVAVLSVGCEDVVDVDLNEAAPRLVIDASINWEKGTSGNEQTIRLTTTAGYFQTGVPTVSNAVVFITDENGTVFQFVENPGTGNYVCNDFIPVIDRNYVLTVIHEDETYTASETLKSVPIIDMITQRNDGGFAGEDIEVKTFFTDDGTTEDYYLIKYQPSYAVIPEFDISSDEFFQGNQFSDFFSSEDLSSGDTLGISLRGISKQYYNYMAVLGNIIGGGGPFQAPPANLKGNVVNQTNFNNYAFGYFSVSEMDSREYIVE